MGKDTEFQGKRVLVVGLGKSGLAAAEFLRARGAKVTLGDEKPIAVPPTGFEFTLLGPQTKPDFDFLVQSPGVPLEKPYFEKARQAGVKVTGEVELAAPFLRGPVIGITGANGKTTTTTWTALMMAAGGVACQTGGNIGRPVTDMVATSREDQWNILELSSFQLETIETFSAKIAMVLNITANHLDRHHTMDAYVAAKARLLETQKRGSVAVLNADDSVTAKLAAKVRGEIVWFSSTNKLDQGYCIDGEWIILDGQRLMPLESLGVPGRHNVENCMAAAAASLLAGASRDGVCRAAKDFHGVEHRIEFVRERRGVRYYNDSKSTTAEATETAAGAFQSGLWLILGGSDKGLQYGHLSAVLRPKVKGVLLIGKIAQLLASQLGSELPITICGTMAAAVEHAASKASPGDVVLLSPGTASYDQFANYEERGRAFKEIVNALEK